MFEFLEHPKENQEFYFCKDEKGNIEGALAFQIKKEEVYIDILLTHPKNIESSLNNESERVKGVGSRLLEKAEESARFLGKRQVSLKTAPTARTFYEQKGYERSSQEGSDSCDMVKSMQELHSSRNCG